MADLKQPLPPANLPATGPGGIPAVGHRMWMQQAHDLLEQLAGIYNSETGVLDVPVIKQNGTPIEELIGRVPIVIITANHTVQLTDRGKSLLMQGTTAGQAITIPAFATIALGQGAAITIENYSNQNWNLTPAGGVSLFWPPTLATGVRVLAAGASCVIHALFNDIWSLTGVGIS